jgi:hypothetical protein
MASSFRKPNGFFKGFDITGEMTVLSWDQRFFEGFEITGTSSYLKKSSTHPTVVRKLFFVFNTRCTPACSGVGWLLSCDLVIKSGIDNLPVGSWFF